MSLADSFPDGMFSDLMGMLFLLFSVLEMPSRLKGD